MNPEHLLEQADELLRAPAKGAPRQDLEQARRAMVALHAANAEQRALLLAMIAFGGRGSRD